jgi:hypothetical protein
MHIQNRKLGWKFFILLIAFFLAAIVSVDPFFEKGPLTRIRLSVGNSVLKVWGWLAHGRKTTQPML